MKYFKRPEHRDVQITGGFWRDQLDKIRDVTVWDVLTKFEQDHDGIMKNYEWVAEGVLGKHVGPPWYDGLIGEVIRGVSDFLAYSYDEELDRRLEYYTDQISRAQDTDPDHYLNTYTTLICPDQRWGENGGSLIWQHETYNIGCLVEAGIHYYRAVGKAKLLKCAILAADCMCAVMGPAPRKNIVPAHSLAEEALIKLYRLLSDEPALSTRLEEEYGISVEAGKYLELVRFWMDHRGVHHNRASHPAYMGEYAQDHCPVEQQSEAVGHAVRAALMYTGLAALGMETDDEKYLAAAKRIWDNVEQTKLHISGGIGAQHQEERFGYQYDLPNDAYLETCAGAALAFWAGEMFLAYGESHYMDVFECALYNNVLPGLSGDGTHYFYENPLVSDGSRERWSWHPCPCCPPMFLKLMGALPDYIYAYGEDRIYVNLQIGSSAEFTAGGQRLTVEQKECKLPWSGENQIVVHSQEESHFSLYIRKPAWAEHFTARIGGQEYTDCDENGYLVITRNWSDQDMVEIKMDLPPVKVEAHPYVSADVGRVALMRGPLLYCLEEADNPKGTDITLGSAPLKLASREVCGSAVCTCIEGVDLEGQSFVAIPYYMWANRKPGSMQVWLRQDKKDGRNAWEEVEAAEFAAHRAGLDVRQEDMRSWEGKLYRRYKD